MPRQKITRHGIFKNVMEFILRWPPTAGYGPGHKSGLCTQWDYWRKPFFFLCKHLLMGDSFWVGLGMGTCVPLSQCWDPVWPRPVQALRVLPQSLCKSVCVSFFFSLCHFSEYELVSHSGLDLYLLRINHGEHYFICIHAIWICSLEKCSAHCLFKHDFFMFLSLGLFLDSEYQSIIR